MVQSIPAGLVVGSANFSDPGKTVTAIDYKNNIITLSSAPSTAIIVPTTRTFTSAYSATLTITNGNLTSGTTSAASDLHYWALP